MDRAAMTSDSPTPNTAPRPAPRDDGGWVGVFVRRPILAVVLNLLVIIAGIAAVQSIEIRELPDVDRPVVTVRSTYAGATPESMDAQITAIVESAVSRVQGVTSISSNSAYGSSRVAVEFSTDTDLQAAAMDVRDAVAGITNQLPNDMEDEPRVVKADADASPIIRMAIASDKLSESELTDLVNNVIEDRLAAVEGVAAANSYGLRAKTIEVRVSQVGLAARRRSTHHLERWRTRRSSCWFALKRRSTVPPMLPRWS
jgi:HAE1 family hydrophobic/amphiphilic exporter-1